MESLATVVSGAQMMPLVPVKTVAEMVPMATMAEMVLILNQTHILTAVTIFADEAYVAKRSPLLPSNRQCRY